MDSSDDTEMESGTSGVPNGSASNGAPSGSASAVNVTNGHEANGHGQPSPEDLTYTRESNDYEMEECNESEDEEEISQPLPANSSLLDSVNVTNYLTRNPRVLERFKQGEAMVNEMIHTMSENRNGMDFINAFTPNSVASVSLLHQLYMPQSLQPCVGVNQRTPSPTLGQNISSTIESNQMAAVHTSSRSLCGQPISSNPRPLSVSPQPGSSRNNGETPMTPSRSNGESSRETDPSSRSLIPVSNQHGTVQSGSNWSYEEQFRQLYEIDDNPERKVFLDKLFSFMHQRGTPINRLPIMAKSVLDLFELYKLVIQRGGLVEVINKKLWQEIIKGLRLPASITSAAFTLRTQYMKYLYPYEQTYEKLSTSCQLQQAIETNKRESRQKPNPTIMAVTYPANRESQSALGMNTLSIGLPGPINPSGSQQPRTPHMLMPNGNQHPQHLTQMPNEYMIKMLNEQRRTMPQDNQSQPIDPIVARMMWMYQQNMYSGRPPTPEPSPPTPEPPTPEPQALDLARSDSDRSSSRPVSPRGEPSSSRRDRENTDQLPATNCKRKSYSDDEEMLENNRKSKAMKTQTVTICEFRPDALVVRIKLDRTVYEGSLPIKHEESGSDTDEPDASGKQQ